MHLLVLASATQSGQQTPEKKEQTAAAMCTMYGGSRQLSVTSPILLSASLEIGTFLCVILMPKPIERRTAHILWH